MAKQAAALQKRTASHKRAAVRRRPRNVPPLRERLPEIFELPFVKPVRGHSIDEELFLPNVDYWAPETGGDYLDEEFRGGRYALLTAQFMARHWEESSILLRIFDTIAAKGGLWPSKRDPKAEADSVAIGFVAAIGDLLKHAAANGTARNCARSKADHLAACLGTNPPRWKADRASMERAITAFRTLSAGDDEAGARFAVRVTDASMNKSIPKGAHAMCAPLEDRVYSGQEFAIGAILYIERERHGLKEHTLRRVSQINGNKMRLATHSKEARFDQEITYPPHPAKEKIRLLGRVRGVCEDI